MKPTIMLAFEEDMNSCQDEKFLPVSHQDESNSWCSCARQPLSWPGSGWLMLLFWCSPFWKAVHFPILHQHFHGFPAGFVPGIALLWSLPMAETDRWKIFQPAIFFKARTKRNEKPTLSRPQWLRRNTVLYQSLSLEWALKRNRGCSRQMPRRFQRGLFGH